MFGFIKKPFIWSLNNQQCIIQPTLINLHSDEYSQGLSYYPLPVNLDRCVVSYNSFNDLSTRVCFPNKTDLNLNVFNTITVINESKTLTKHIS